jgi:hypothetical protein
MVLFETFRDLVASFRSTLDERLDASLLLHVVDASDPLTFKSHEKFSEVIDAGTRARVDVLGIECGHGNVIGKLSFQKCLLRDIDGIDLVQDEKRRKILRRKRRVSHDQSNSGTLAALKRRLAS